MSETVTALRARIRSGRHSGPTAGLAAGCVQCNIVILPADWAADFLRFCQRNPRPCPLLARAARPGATALPKLGDIDIRSDVPRYRVFEHGQMVAEVNDIGELWRDDLVSFALGCSFSFEEALLAAGLEIRHISAGVNVPMYRSNIPCRAAGPFAGNMVVSMRPLPAADAIRAVQICSGYPAVHGAPVHLGDPALIGIADIQQPDYGDAVTLHAHELPVFWGCGVTPQVALEAAKPPFCITHSPGCMLVTELSTASLKTAEFP